MIGDIVERTRRFDLDHWTDETTTRVDGGPAVLLFPDGTALTMPHADVTLVVRRYHSFDGPESMWRLPPNDHSEVRLDCREFTLHTPNPRIRRYLYRRVLGWLART